MSNLRATIARLRLVGKELEGLWAYDDDAINLAVVRYARGRMRDELVQMDLVLEAQMAKEVPSGLCSSPSTQP